MLSALPDLALSGSFVVTWVAPGTFGTTMPSHLMMVMLLEFIIVHSTAFMGYVSVSPAQRMPKALALLGLSAIYSLFAGAFSLAFHSWWPLGAFWGLTANRLTTVLFGRAPDGRATATVMASWGIGAACYLVAVIVTSVAPVPALGITPAVIAAQHFTASGLWIDEPQRVLAAGALYFAAIGLAELLVVPRIARAGDARPTMAVPA